MDDEEPDHCYCSPARGLVGFPSTYILSIDSGDDEMARGHPDGAEYENRLPAQFVDIHNSRDLNELARLRFRKEELVIPWRGTWQLLQLLSLVATLCCPTSQGIQRSRARSRVPH